MQTSTTITETQISRMESTRRCARDHAGSRCLDATGPNGRHYVCRGCGQFYSHTEVILAGLHFPSTTPGVEVVASTTGKAVA